MKYRIDDWVLYTMFPEIESLKNKKIRAVILEVLSKNTIYDYRIYLNDGTARIKNVKEENLNPSN